MCIRSLSPDTKINHIEYFNGAFMLQRFKWYYSVLSRRPRTMDFFRMKSILRVNPEYNLSLLFSSKSVKEYFSIQTVDPCFISFGKSFLNAPALRRPYKITYVPNLDFLVSLVWKFVSDISQSVSQFLLLQQDVYLRNGAYIS